MSNEREPQITKPLMIINLFNDNYNYNIFLGQSLST